MRQSSKRARSLPRRAPFNLRPILSPALIPRILHQKIVPHHGDGCRCEMPQGVRIDNAGQWRKVEQLECTGRCGEDHKNSGLADERRAIGFRPGGESAESRDGEGIDEPQCVV